MDRRSWLWRRKSSDKSSGETESLGSGSGSMSSPSERFSDDQQVYPIKNTQSPEVTSKHAEDTNDKIKILSEKLSAAVAAITEKEELVKQHAKVAEEAVTGWERAETEMDALKQQLDAATKKNSTLEDKIVHLDGALKECLRQLRQVREEQDLRIQEAITNKSDDTESKSSELQAQLADISAQLEAAVSLETDLRDKLAAFEKKNASLQLELSSQLEAVELRTLERDLSTKRAETVSKQHLESIKRVARLEAECRQLKAMARKGASLSDHKSTNDNRSNTMKLDPASSKSHIEIMDDFLEMEKLVALPGQEDRNCSLRSSISNDKCFESGNDNTLLKDELEAMMKRTVDLEERIERVEAEKVELDLTLIRCRDELNLSESSFRQLEAQLKQCQNQLKLSQAQLKDANKKMDILQAELDLASELRQAIDLELDDANVRREEAEAQLEVIENEAEKERAVHLKALEKCRVLEDELIIMKNNEETWQHELASMKESKEGVVRQLRSINGKKEAVESELKVVKAEVQSLLAKIDLLENEGVKEKCVSVRKEEAEAQLKAIEKEAEKGRARYLEAFEKCRVLEDELIRIKNNENICQNNVNSMKESKEAVERELWDINVKKDALESELESSKSEVESLLAKIDSLEKVREKERPLFVEFGVKCRNFESELSRTKHEADRLVQRANEKKEEVEKQLEAVQAQAKSLLSRVNSLENELEKERLLSAEFAASCKKFEDDLSRMNSEVDIQLVPRSKEELNIQQEKELAVAASKLAECQKTIASLGNQLKSIATLEDLFSDFDKQLDISDKDSHFLGADIEPAGLQSCSRLTVQPESLST